jgi:hypothetical protein
MSWFKIIKSKKPRKGKYYWDWKEQLSVEGRHQCVYCTIGEGPFGGIRNFHIEHYRPKSTPKFKKLEHDYNNLFFACSICNCFKGDDWPNEPNNALNIKCYPNPTKVNYAYIFSLRNDYSLNGRVFAARYIIEKLFLNRPQLKLERRHILLTSEIEKTFMLLKKSVKDLKKKSEYKSGVNKLVLQTLIRSIEINILQNKGRYVMPYKQEEIRR